MDSLGDFLEFLVSLFLCVFVLFWFFVCFWHFFCWVFVGFFWLVGFLVLFVGGFLFVCFLLVSGLDYFYFVCWGFFLSFGILCWTADLSQMLLWMRHFGHRICLFKCIKFYALACWVQISLNNSLWDQVVKAKMLLLRKPTSRDYQEWVIFLLW